MIYQFLEYKTATIPPNHTKQPIITVACNRNLVLCDAVTDLLRSPLTYDLLT